MAEWQTGKMKKWNNLNNEFVDSVKLSNCHSYKTILDKNNI
jgi:hypothetical protein